MDKLSEAQVNNLDIWLENMQGRAERENDEYEQEKIADAQTLIAEYRRVRAENAEMRRMLEIVRVAVRD